MTFRVPFVQAKRTFGTLTSEFNASDYTLFKKQNIYCCPCPCANSNDPTILNNNLIKKMDLHGVNVLQTLYPISNPVTPTTINPSSTFYLTYRIDADGLLFGNSPCGINNYPNYMVYK